MTLRYREFVAPRSPSCSLVSLLLLLLMMVLLLLLFVLLRMLLFLMLRVLLSLDGGAVLELE